MRFMSVDASTSSTGYAIFEGEELIAYGRLQPKQQDWRERIIEQADLLKNLIVRYSPAKIVVEDVPLMGKGGNKVLVQLGAVQGMLLTLGLPLHFITPSQWRSIIGLFDGTVKGTQRNEMKKKSIEKANKLYGLNLIYKSPTSKYNEDDISDSILIGYSQICHANKKRDFRKGGV